MNRMPARIIVLLSVCLMAFAACGDEASVEGFFANADYLELPPAVNMGGNQTQAEFNIKSNCSWNITGMPSWFRVSPSSGSGDAKVTINADENGTSLESRSAGLTVSTPDGLKFNLSVTQLAAAEVLTLDVTDVITFPTDGGNRSIAVHNNSRWTVTGMTDWLVLDRTSGEGNMDINLTVHNNPNETERQAVITVQGVSKSVAFTVKQAELVTTLTLLPERKTIDAGAGEVVITLDGNAVWTASSDADWATPDQLTGKGSATVRVQCQANTSTESRLATVTFNTTRTTLTCVITQNGGTPPLLTAPVVSDVTKYSASLAATYTSSFEVTEYGFCISRNPNPTLSDTKLTFSGSGMSGSFNTNVGELESDVTYYIRSYAVNAYGTSYSDEVTFTTKGSKPDSSDVVPPVLAPKR